MHSLIVSNRYHHTAVDAGVGDRVEKIGRHVQPHVLHGAEGAYAGEACAESRFACDLFIGSPFGVYILIL